MAGAGAAHEICANRLTKLVKGSRPYAVTERKVCPAWIDLAPGQALRAGPGLRERGPRLALARGVLGGGLVRTHTPANWALAAAPQKQDDALG